MCNNEWYDTLFLGTEKINAPNDGVEACIEKLAKNESDWRPMEHIKQHTV